MNLLQPIEIALRNKTFENGLLSYTQSNCQVTLTDKGYRIYRPPNLTLSEVGQTVWGGLKIQPHEIDSNILIQGHTYIILFDVEGQTSNYPDIGWSNNMGYGGHDLMPNPSDVEYVGVPSNFSGKMNVKYRFTINDSIYKTCTYSYSYFVEGEQYLSYKDFYFKFEYQDTGSLGTDLYITNIQMYDITTNKNIEINKKGIIACGDFNEYNPRDISSSVHIGNYTLANKFIEI